MSTVFYSFLLVLAILHSDLCKKLGMMDRERSIDKKSLEERKKCNCTELQSEAKNEQLQGLYFDVIKDETLVINKAPFEIFSQNQKRRTLFPYSRTGLCIHWPCFALFGMC